MEKKTISIIKVGGKIINEEAHLQYFLEKFSEIPNPKILIHGGGRKASELSHKLGIEPNMIDGRRVTDKATLDIVVMTYAGLVNKSIVTHLQSLGSNALGLSGADLNIIQCHKRKHESIDYGYVGDIDDIDDKTIEMLLDNEIIPVFCAITHNTSGQLLNTNADTIASQIAIALSGCHDVTLQYCFEFDGVLKDIAHPKETISKIDKQVYQILREDQILTSGIIPKIDNALMAKKQGVNEVCICGVDNLISKNNATWIQ